eukprot:gnl/Trimastix_PCT/2936.p1 GENE.gnl/Trimastix_PCT/2936~~gnl/Trimastix_PCT/2936.p1  ORF type:complete len:228 (+),score=22.38 gnl/Trimastix_PCT/2936:37-720(+)
MTSFRHAPRSSSNKRAFRIFRQRYSASCSVSPSEIPTRTQSPGPIEPTTRPSTSTRAEVTLWMTPRILLWLKDVMQTDREVLLVSQFTLYGNMKANKPDFHGAMGGDRSRPFFDTFVERVGRAYRPDRIQTGEFGAMMQVHIVNDGPVTIWLDSAQWQSPNGQGGKTAAATTTTGGPSAVPGKTKAERRQERLRLRAAQQAQEAGQQGDAAQPAPTPAPDAPAEERS